METVLLDKKGMTLVEVLIAMLVLLFVSLAMMQTALVSIDSNMINVLRDEAVNIAEMRMSEARNLPFTETVTDLVSDTADVIPDVNFPIASCQTPPVSDPNPYPVLVTRNIRNIANFSYGTRRTVALIGTDDMQVTILVRWEFRNICYTHGISTVIKRETS